MAAINDGGNKANQSGKGAKESGKKKDDKKKSPKRHGAMRRRARRDVRAAYDPTFDAIREARIQAKDDLGEAQQRTSDIYGDAAQQIANMIPNFSGVSQGIAGAFGNEMADLQGLFGAEGADLAGVMGTGGLANLGAGLQAGLANVQGGAQQAVSQGVVDQREFLQDYQDLVASLQREKLDAKKDMRTGIQQRLDELRQQKWERKMAEREYELRKTLAEDDRAFRDKTHRQERRDEKRQQDTAESFLEEKELKADLRKDITRLMGVLERLEGKAGRLDEGLPGKMEQRNGTWGYVHPQTGEFVPVPQYADIIRQQRQTKRKIKRKRRRRRKL